MYSKSRCLKTMIVTLLTIFLYTDVYCQSIIKGKVVDSQNKEPLAFVNILFNGDTQSGTITDIDGRFSYRSPKKIKSLTCSYVGYEQKTFSLDSFDDSEDLLIELSPSTFLLQEIVVLAGENPADRIIRKTIKNKKTNNPESISSFKYNSYNKVIYDLESDDTTIKDSIQIIKDRVLQGGHILIMESVTERKFIQPDISEETIIGVKVSGFKNPSFAPLATDLQPFSFYKEVIPIFDVNYLNPISNGALKKYQYSIEDTLYQNSDTTFVISFKPRPGKNIEGLTGLLYINTNQYAIQNVIAEPAEKGLIDIKIQQKYQFVDNKQWFPEQLNFEMVIGQSSSESPGVSVNGKSYISNITLLAELNKKDFSLESVKMHDRATNRDSLFWREYRIEPLEDKETITYQVIDSIGEEFKFDSKLKFIEKVSQSKVPVKFVDIDLTKTLVYNRFEGLRLGAGLYTNEKFLKHLSIGGFFGYGLKDNQWKYGGGFTLTLDKEKELKLSGNYQNTLLETGNTGLDFFNSTMYNFRSLLASQMDRIEQYSFSIDFRAFKFTKLNLSLNQTRVAPQYNYEFQSDEQQSITDYNYSNISLNLRFAFKEKLIKSLNQRVSLGTKYPIVYLHYTRGIKGVFNGEFDFNKIAVRIEDFFYVKNLGETKIRLEGGYIDESLPYGLLFTGEGSYEKNWPVLMRNYFQTAAPYEFLSDRYVHLHFSHNFGSLLLQINNFKPHITFYQNIGWGNLSNAANHQTIDFKTMDKGLYESGLQFDNLIKIKYLNIAYLGLGAGAFYRYGPYASREMTDNLAFKFSFLITTK